MPVIRTAHPSSKRAPSSLPIWALAGGIVAFGAAMVGTLLVPNVAQTPPAISASAAPEEAFAQPAAPVMVAGEPEAPVLPASGTQPAYTHLGARLATDITLPVAPSYGLAEARELTNEVAEGSEAKPSAVADELPMARQAAPRMTTPAEVVEPTKPKQDGATDTKNSGAAPAPVAPSVQDEKPDVHTTPEEAPSAPVAVPPKHEEPGRETEKPKPVKVQGKPASPAKPAHRAAPEAQPSVPTRDAVRANRAATKPADSASKNEREGAQRMPPPAPSFAPVATVPGLPPVVGVPVPLPPPLPVASAPGAPAAPLEPLVSRPPTPSEPGAAAQMAPGPTPLRARATPPRSMPTNSVALLAVSPDRIWVRVDDQRTLMLSVGQQLEGHGRLTRIEANRAVFENGTLRLP